MSDPTETIRRQRVAEINAEPGSREALKSNEQIMLLQKPDECEGCEVEDHESGQAPP